MLCHSLLKEFGLFRMKIHPEIFHLVKQILMELFRKITRNRLKISAMLLFHLSINCQNYQKWSFYASELLYV